MIRRFEAAMTCYEENVQGEDVIVGVVSPTGRREAWHSLNGSATTCRDQLQQQQQQQQQRQQQEGSSLAKRPRRPAPPPPPEPAIPAQQCATASLAESSASSSSSCSSSSSSSTNKESHLEQDEATPLEQEHKEAVQQQHQRDMGANLSRHSGKGLKGRRAQSSGSLCDGKGISVSKILAPCSRSSKESKYKYCGSLPNHLDGKDSLDDETSENNNVITDTISGNLGGTLPHKKSHVSAHFSDDPSHTLELVKHRSEESLDGDPWKYRLEGADLARCRYAESLRKSRGSDAGSSVSGCSHHHQHQHHHHEWRRNSSTLSRGRCHRSAELDVTGTLPKRRQDSTKRSAPSLRELGDGPTRASRISIDKIDDDLLFRRPSSQQQHKQPDSEATDKQKQQEQQKNHKPQPHGKYVDLKLHKLTAGGEPQDQGYASERSPEDEHLPPLPDQPFPSVTPESTFRVILTKSSRGLGLSVSGGGTSGPVRVKRLFPQQPAALSNKLQPGDVLLAANGTPLTGLTNYEALEVLRTTSSTVELVVCRPPGAEVNSTTPPDAAPPPPPTRKDNPGLTLKIPMNPLPPLDVEPCGEFDIELTKVAGSLGFTLRKTDSSALGHYVRALVREPALSDGRIHPGDKIIAVDGATLSPLSHEDAVALLRRCGPTVRLRLYRDLAQTPVSALSPTEPDYPDRPTKTCLRQEAVDMLCDLAVRKLSPGTSNGSSSCPRQSSGTSSNSPRRLRRPATRSSTADTDEASGGSVVQRNGSDSNRHSRASTLSQETSDSDQCSIKTQITNSQPETPGNDIIDPPPLYDLCDAEASGSTRPTNTTTTTTSSSFNNSSSSAHRPSFLDLRGGSQNQSHNHHHHQHHQQQQPAEHCCSNGKSPRFQYNVESDSESSAPAVANDDVSEPIHHSNHHHHHHHHNHHHHHHHRSYRAATATSGGLSDELSNEPASMPPQLGSSAGPAFSYKNPAYQSANPACCGLQPDSAATATSVAGASTGKTAHSSEQDIPRKIMGADEPGGTKGLLKWKGVQFAPRNSDETDGRCMIREDRSNESAALASLHEQGYEVFMIELTRGWNSRLGFSLQPEGDKTVISVVHPDSLAAKDGRLRQGDVVIMVNEESVEEMSTADVIDLLRKIRGSIGITVLRRKKDGT